MRTMLFFLLCSASAALAQTPNGTIKGTVLDAQGAPVADADVYAPPSKVRARTDSAGRFVLANLPPDFYYVRIRHIGFSAAEITTDLGKGGSADLKFEMKRRPAVMDSVIVLADGNCPMRRFTGFNCRRRTTKGVFLTDDDIMDRGAIELGDIFRDVPGFRIENQMTQFGLKPAPIPTRGNHCLNALVNGRASSRANPLPRYAADVLAVEIYAMPGDVPPEYQQFVALPTARQSAPYVPHDSPTNRCALAVYWTEF